MNLALAIIDTFDISLHQPQPPGFLFHIIFGKAVHVFIGNPFTVTELQSLVYLMITLFIIRNAAERKPGHLLLFGTVPLFLFLSAAPVMQAASIPFSAMTALVCVKSLRENRGYPVVFAVLFGLGIGFRYDFALFLGPVALLVTAARKPPFREWLIAFLLFSGITLLWYIPTSVMSGNVSPLLSTIDVQRILSSGVSFIRGGLLSENIRCALRFLMYLPGVFGIGTLFIIIGNFRKADPSNKIICLTAVLPFFGMGILLFMPLPQYYASVTSFILVFMMKTGRLNARGAVLISGIIINLVFFWVVPRPLVPEGNVHNRGIAVNTMKQLSYTGSNGAAVLLHHKKLMNLADATCGTCPTFYSPLLWDRIWKYLARYRWNNRFTADRQSADCILEYRYRSDGSVSTHLYPEPILHRGRNSPDASR